MDPFFTLQMVTCRQHMFRYIAGYPIICQMVLRIMNPLYCKVSTYKLASITRLQLKEISK